MASTDIGHFTVGSIWISYIIAVCILFFFAVGFAKLYQHRTEKDGFVTTVTVLAITSVLATICLFPVDIALVSTTVNRATGLRKDWASPERVETIVLSLKVVYYGKHLLLSFRMRGIKVLEFGALTVTAVLYAIDSLFCLLIIPFTYFWYEEWDEESTLGSRVRGASKYSALFLLITLALLLTGFFIPISHDLTGGIDLDYLKHLLSENHGEKALSFVLGVLLSLGIIFYVVYTAPGFALFPINLIRRIPTLQISDVDSARQALEHNRECQRRIQIKYQGTGMAMSVKDRKELEALHREERTLTRRHRLAEESGNRQGWTVKIYTALQPFRVAFGVILALLGILIVVSMGLTLGDKMSNSLCGGRCGYIIGQAQVFNPVNYIFLQGSKAYPIDFIFMVILILYFFIATVVGIVFVGIRFLWVDLYKIRRHGTLPQGLLMGTIFLMLSILALMYSLTTIVAPQYAHFGGQTYCNHTIGDWGEVRDCTDVPQAILPCSSASEAKDICTQTVVSLFLNRITLTFPFFGGVAFWGQFAFLGVWVVAGLAGVLRRPRMEDLGERGSDDEDDERTGLLES